MHVFPIWNSLHQFHRQNARKRNPRTISIYNKKIISLYIIKRFRRRRVKNRKGAGRGGGVPGAELL